MKIRYRNITKQGPTHLPLTMQAAAPEGHRRAVEFSWLSREMGSHTEMKAIAEEVLLRGTGGDLSDRNTSRSSNPSTEHSTPITLFLAQARLV